MGNKYAFEVEVIREGQPRAYADSEYEYIITTTNVSEFDVKRFCTSVVRPNKQEVKDWDVHNADSYFGGYHMLEKLSENKYRYYVKEPYTG